MPLASQDQESRAAAEQGSMAGGMRPPGGGVRVARRLRPERIEPTTGVDSRRLSRRPSSTPMPAFAERRTQPVAPAKTRKLGECFHEVRHRAGAWSCRTRHATRGLTGYEDEPPPARNRLVWINLATHLYRPDSRYGTMPSPFVLRLAPGYLLLALLTC